MSHARLARSIGVAGLLVAVGSSSVLAQTSAGTTLDDRSLKRSTGKKAWTKVSSKKAYKKTLLRTRRTNATLEARTRATNGGSVTFQTGPGRGQFTVTVGTGKAAKKKTVKTASRSARLKTVTFTGSGVVRLKVTKPGRRGVYVDGITLKRRPAVTPVPMPTVVVPAPTATPAPAPTATPTPATCPVGTSDGGTLVTSRGTNQRVCKLPGRVAANLVLQNLPGVVYALGGPVEVGSDVGGDGAKPGGNAATLTIEAGVVVVSDDQFDALVVHRGSRINALGTAAQPIVFTIRANLTGTAQETGKGTWGGITLLGRGPISDCDTAVPGGSTTCERTVTGLSVKYGGNQPNDTSGTLTYVQIRFAGLGTDGAALRAAGTGQLTQIDHVQTFNSAGDGLAVLGGRTNFASLALAGSFDDTVFTDVGYRGTIQYLVGVQAGGDNGDSMITADSVGNEDALPRQYARISNATLVGRTVGGDGNAVLIRGGADFALLNSLVLGTAACLDLDETAGTTTRAADGALQDFGAPLFRSSRLATTCTDPYRSDGDVSTATITNIFGSGTNGNSSSHTSTLTGFANGSNETTVTATNPTTFNSDGFAGTGQPNAAAPNRMAAVTAIGALDNPADTRFRGWTCDATWASFGSGTTCVSSPL